jgi:ubiquinone biosynthesis protein UbiJ
MKASEVGQYEEAIACGKELKRLEREIGALQQKLERIERLSA